MPAAYLKRLAKKTGISVKELEKEWESANDAVGDQYPVKSGKRFGTITKIFKHKINKHFGLDEVISFKNYFKIKEFIKEKDDKFETRTI